MINDVAIIYIWSRMIVPNVQALKQTVGKNVETPHFPQKQERYEENDKY